MKTRFAFLAESAEITGPGLLNVRSAGAAYAFVEFLPIAIPISVCLQVELEPHELAPLLRIGVEDPMGLPIEDIELVVTWSADAPPRDGFPLVHSSIVPYRLSAYSAGTYRFHITEVENPATLSFLVVLGPDEIAATERASG
jgi:hypothetical protein